MHCNLRQPDAAQSLSSALISSPVSSLNSLTLSVAVVERFTAYTLHYVVTLNSDHMTLTFDLWHWTCTVNRLRRGQTLYEIWAKSDNPRWRYCSLNIWPYDLEHVSRALLCCGIVCTKFKLSQAIRSWHAMTLTFYPLILKVCGRSGVTWSCIVCSKFNRNRTTLGWVIHNLANFGPHYVTVTLTLDPVTLNFCDRSGIMLQYTYQIWSKSNNPRLSYW